MSDVDTLFSKAKAAQAKAYAPYSEFPVGCCIKTNTGAFYAGCNVENASYGLTNCAEASAISNMVTSGETRIEAIAVIGNGDVLCSPCGACRQRIREFATLDTPVYLFGPEGLRKTMTLNELLPESFGPENLS